MNLLLIAIGGALGSVARYGLSVLVYRVVPQTFPFGTFSVNVVGCIVFGLLAGYGQGRGTIGAEARAFLFVGVLGGFTTFSTFAFESVDLLRDGRVTWAVLNVGGQVVAGLAGLWAGLTLAARV